MDRAFLTAWNSGKRFQELHNLTRYAARRRRVAYMCQTLFHHKPLDKTPHIGYTGRNIGRIMS